MRNMAFSLTTKQMYARTKTVTRRCGWHFLKPGDIVMAVEKGMGLKKGEKIKRIYPIQIISVYWEPLHLVDEPGELAKEGFPEMSPEKFIEMFCHANKNKHMNSRVNRIEFREYGGPSI